VTYLQTEENHKDFKDYILLLKLQFIWLFYTIFIIFIKNLLLKEHKIWSFLMIPNYLFFSISIISIIYEIFKIFKIYYYNYQKNYFFGVLFLIPFYFISCYSCLGIFIIFVSGIIHFKIYFYYKKII
jgi:hypothetical protein